MIIRDTERNKAGKRVESVRVGVGGGRREKW